MKGYGAVERCSSFSPTGHEDTEALAKEVIHPGNTKEVLENHAGHQLHHHPAT